VGRDEDSLADEGKGQKPSDAKLIVTQDLPQANRCPGRLQVKAISKAKNHPFFPPCPRFIAEYDTVWYGKFLWSVQVSCSSCVPSQPLAHPNLLPRGWEVVGPE